jgi:hypothetical protein
MPYTGNSILSTMSGISFLLGMVECFVGYKMLKIILGVTGFIIGGLLCAGFVHEILRHHPLIALLAGLLGGVVGGAIMIVFFVFGVFILGVLLGLLIGENVSTLILGTANPFIIVAFIIAGGLATIIMYKSMIIISTSFLGAYLMVFSAGQLLGLPNTLFRLHEFTEGGKPGGQFLIMLLSCIVVGIAGIIVQHKYTSTSGRDRTMKESLKRQM